MSAAPWGKYIDSEWYDYPIRFDAEYRVDDATAIIRHESIRAERMAIPIEEFGDDKTGMDHVRHHGSDPRNVRDSLPHRTPLHPLDGVCAGQPDAQATESTCSITHESGQAAHTPWQPAGPLTTAMVISFWGFCTIGSLYGLYRLIWR